MRAASVVLGVVLLAAPVVTVPVVASAAVASQQEVEEALTCQCGCGLTVHACNHLQCGSGEPIKKEIAERIAAGEDKEAILAAFRERYGEKILSSPAFGGFNWLAWVTPFAAVAAGGLGISLVIRRWVRSPSAPAAPDRPAATGGDDPLRRQLAKELADMDRDG